MEKTPFRVQRETLFPVLAHPRMRRACIDETGLGMQLAEESIEEFGRARVEAVTFNPRVKEDLAYRVRERMEDRRLLIPADSSIRDSFHSIKKVTTVAGNVRFDVDASEATGHADDFWAAALAVHAAQELGSAPVRIVTSGPREISHAIRSY
jgi:phage FluMu gp28-like protein